MPTGIPFEPKKDTVITFLKECKGVVTYAANRMKVDRHTLQSYINKNEDVKEFLQDLRFNYDEEQLDAAQNLLSYAISKKEEDLTNALKSAIFILNNKGKGRGFAHPNHIPESQTSQIEEINRNMKVAYELLDKKV